MRLQNAIRDLVRRRAADHCEYCLLPQSAHPLTFTIDHIVARQHAGGDEEANLALACSTSNWHKGTNLTTVDPLTRQVVAVYNPRTQRWIDHFELIGVTIIGTTAIGRGTIELLNMNSEEQIKLRGLLLTEGHRLHPPLESS